MPACPIVPKNATSPSLFQHSQDVRAQDDPRDNQPDDARQLQTVEEQRCQQGDGQQGREDENRIPDREKLLKTLFLLSRAVGPSLVLAPPGLETE